VLSFVELREKVKLKGGEKEVKSYKAGKRKDKEVVISKKGSKYAVYVDSELLDNDYKNEKEAVKAASDMLKLLGI
jgi:23S rRNA G2069 N7-methylase RlmK/C1962 C5-methylase RlmI